MSINEDLKAFIDDELSPERAAEVQAAIDRDPALREEYLFMKLLSGEIKSAARQPQVAGLDKAVGKTAKSGPGFKFNRWAAYGATGAVAIMLIGFVGSVLPGPFSRAESAAKATGSAALADEAMAKTAKVASPPTAGSESPKFKSESEAGKWQSGAGRRDAEHDGVDENVGGGGDFGRKGSAEAKPLERNYNGTVTLPDTTTNQANAYAERSRMVIRTANMGLKVKDVSKAMSDTEIQVAAMGGFVENTSFNQADDASKGLMSFQIPEKNFDAIVEYLGKAGTIVSNNKTGQDVTGHVAYTDGQIRSLADEEHNLIEELQRTKNSGDRLEIRSRLSSVRQEMEGLKEQNKVTKDLAAMSRFSVSFEKSGQLDEAKPSDWFGQTTAGAGDLLGFFGRIFGVGIIYTLFLAPIWLPVAGGVWWLRKRARANAALSDKTD